MVNVLIVDDSAFMRNAISSMLSSDPEIKVIGTAKDGLEAIAKVKTLKPDIVTLDIEMPRMDGLEALKIIMASNPLPVVIVSSLTSEGAKVTLEALEHGALDYIPKNLADLSVNILKIKEVLIEKIKKLSGKKVAKIPTSGRPASESVRPLSAAMITGERRMSILAIGTSTGGPKALQDIVPNLPKEFPIPIIIAQHMPPNFTKPFADRLNQLSKIKVKEAEQYEVLEPGCAYVAPGRGHMRVRRKSATKVTIEVSEDKENFIYRPSVDALLASSAEVFPGRTLGVVLTGMGNDGLNGAREVKKSGGRIFAQNEESSVVYGMPKAIVDAGLADKILSIEEMAGEIVNSV